MDVIKISDLIAEKISGEWGEEDTKVGTAVNIIRTANFTNSGTISYNSIVKREVDENKISKKQLIDGDVIIEKSGGSPSQPVGRVVYFSKPNNEIYLCNNFTSILRPNRNKVVPKYFFYLLYSNYYTGKINEFQNKTTGIINLQLDRYLDSTIKYEPDLETQDKIVAILDNANAVLKKRQTTISMYDELLQATFLEMFGDVANNPKGFEKIQASQLGTIITGNTPPRNDETNYNSKFIEWIKTDNITKDSHLLTPASEYLSEIGFNKSRHVPKNSLLVACIAGSIESIGRCAISDRRVSFNQQINAIVPNKDVSVYFLYWMFKVSSKYIQSFATKGMKRLLTKGEFEKILLLNPPYDDQLEFESIAKRYSHLLSKLQNFKAESQNLLRSLSSQFFEQEKTVDRDSQLESIFDEINLNKKEEENDIESVKNDLALVKRLIARLKEQEFENKEQYDKAKYILFRIMKEDEGITKQEFRNSKIEVTLNETH